MIKVSDDFILMIDYAHNAMSLESLLTTLKEYHPKRLVCVFGCGGNRSKLRRYEMGEVSGICGLTVITSDNPRFEEPQAIIDDIKVGMAKPRENMWRSLTERSDSLCDRTWSEGRCHRAGRKRPRGLPGDQRSQISHG